MTITGVPLQPQQNEKQLHHNRRHNGRIVLSAFQLCFHKLARLWDTG